jgi:hypothetical protein
MNCKEITKQLTDFSEGLLSLEEEQQIREHLKGCASCQKELQQVNLVWEKLGAWFEAEPDPGYASRFWTRLASEKAWYEKTWDLIKPALQLQKLAPAIISLAILVVIGYLAFRPAFLDNPMTLAKTELPPDQVELIENVDLVENIDVIEDIEFLQDMEYIKKLNV